MVYIFLQRSLPRSFPLWVLRTSSLYHSRLCSRKLSVSRLSFRFIPVLGGLFQRSLPPMYPCRARTFLFPWASPDLVLRTTPFFPYHRCIRVEHVHSFFRGHPQTWCFAQLLFSFDSSCALFRANFLLLCLMSCCIGYTLSA